MNLKDEYQIKFLKNHVEEEKNSGKKLSVQEEDLKTLNILNQEKKSPYKKKNRKFNNLDGLLLEKK